MRVSDAPGCVLITGATGLIGRHVQPLLVSDGFEVHAAARRRSAEPASGVIGHALDLGDHEAVERAIAVIRPTHLVHLAWTTERDYYTTAENVRWLSDSLRLIRAFVEAGGRRIVAAGSSAEYELSGESDLSETATPLRPNGLYGQCKKALADVTAMYAAGRPVTFAWARVFFCYGPGEHEERLVPRLLEALERGERVPFQPGEALRDYVYVKDVAAAFVRLVRSDLEGAVNVGSGRPTSLRAFVSGLAEAAGAPGHVEFGALPAPAYEPRRVVADIRRIREELGWEPEWTLADGLRETVERWRSARMARAGADHARL